MNTPIVTYEAAPPALPPALPYGGHPYSAPEPDLGTGMRGLANTLLQHARAILIAVITLLLLAILYLLFATPVYRAESLVQVEERKMPPLVSNVVAPPTQVAQFAASPLLGEIEILRSRELMTQALTAAGLDVDIQIANRLPIVGPLYARWWQSRGERGVAPAPLGLTRFAWGGERLRIASIEFPPSLTEQELMLRGDGSNRWQLLDPEGRVLANGQVGRPADFVVDGQRARLEVAELRGAAGVEFTLIKRTPGNVYDDLLKTIQITEAARQSGVIRISYDDANRNRAVRLLDELTSRYVASTAARRSTEAEQQLRFLEQQLPELKRKLDASEQALSTFRARTSTLNVDQETQSTVGRVAQLERDRVDLQMRAQQLSQKFLPSHPELQAIQQQRRVVDAELDRLTRQSYALPSNQREFFRLQREVNTNAVLYTALLTNMQELQVARASMAPLARVVDPPSATEKPVRPKPLLILSIAGALGLLTGVTLAFVRRQLRPTIQDADDIELNTGLLTLAYIPESPRQQKLMRWSMMPRGGKPQLLALHAPTEPAIESLRSFRSNLTLPSARQIERTVLIAAPTAGLGKTFIAANLAALLASANKRVLLIDADLRRPRLHRYFRAPAAPGLAEILSGELSFSDVARAEAMNNLDLLLAGRARRNPADLLQSPNLRRLLDELEERYDCVVIDSPPVLPVADSLAFAQFGLQTFLVARAEQTTVREVREAARRLTSVGGRVQGVLFNGVKRARFGNLSYYAYPNGG